VILFRPLLRGRGRRSTPSLPIKNPPACMPAGAVGSPPFTNIHGGSRAGSRRTQIRISPPARNTSARNMPAAHNRPADDKQPPARVAHTRPAAPEHIRARHTLAPNKCR
jgi:hypothetical protein